MTAILLSVLIGAMATFICVLMYNMVSVRRDMNTKIDGLYDEFDELVLFVKNESMMVGTGVVFLTRSEVGFLRNQLEQCIENSYFSMAAIIRDAIDGKTDTDIVDIPDGMIVTYNEKEGIYKAKVLPR